MGKQNQLGNTILSKNVVVTGRNLHNSSISNRPVCHHPTQPSDNEQLMQSLITVPPKQHWYAKITKGAKTIKIHTKSFINRFLYVYNDFYPNF